MTLTHFKKKFSKNDPSANKTKQNIIYLVKSNSIVLEVKRFFQRV